MGLRFLNTESKELKVNDFYSFESKAMHKRSLVLGSLSCVGNAVASFAVE